MELAAALPWNRWQAWHGISGSFTVERVAAFAWNQWQLSRGIRSTQRVLDMSANYLQHRTFILSLFQMTPQQAYETLQQQINAMNEEAIKSFTITLTGLLSEAQQAAQQTGGAAWGVSVEDRMAQFMAEAQAGFPASSAGTQAQMYLQGLQAIAYYANQFYQAKRLREAQIGYESH